jgi:hypothetical protein
VADIISMAKATGAKTASFAIPFGATKDQFTKTGSGQAKGKTQMEMRFSQGTARM